MDAGIVLMHSPLVGPLTWSLVADELRRRSVAMAVPRLVDAGEGRPPFWKRHAAAVARDVGAIPAGAPVVLVGHSGAGPLLPAVGQRVGHPVAAYIFVDAGIPVDGMSRLELMADEDPAFAAHLRELLSGGGQFPSWREEDLRAAIPDARLRHRMVAELQPRPLAFFTEPIPVFSGWPDAPCGYVQFSAAYDAPARHARQAGWSYRAVNGGHFQMLVDPSAVTDALLDLVEHLIGDPTTQSTSPSSA
jgi:hypothetical protein